MSKADALQTQHGGHLQSQLTGYTTFNTPEPPEEGGRAPTAPLLVSKQCAEEVK